jgi:cobalt-zinc-cadmium efflux system protein
LRLSLDGVLEKINNDEINTIATKLNGVKDLHHIHIWSISPTENALTENLFLELSLSIEDEQKIKQELKHQLNHKNIHHITLETERENETCETIVC